METVSTDAHLEVRVNVGMAHLIRGHDVTFGENGWHPHLHILLFCSRPDAVVTWLRAFTQVWRQVVSHELGVKHVPTYKHGVSVDVCHDASYVARLGLEVGSPGGKHAQPGHLTAMQLAHALAGSQNFEQERLAGLWREYSIAMRGCHQLQWSRGLRDELGPTPSDSEIVANDFEVKGRTPIASIPRETWRSMSIRRGVHALDEVGVKLKDSSPEQCRETLLTFFQELEGVPAVWKGDNRLRWLTDD